MNILQAIILGIIQGLTEFIPISSSGHLIVAEKMMGLDKVMSAQQITAFVAVMQLGTLVAVVVYFINDIVSITLGFVNGNLMILKERGYGARDNAARKASRLGWNIIIGTLPIAVVGLLAKKIIEGDLTKNLYVIGISMIAWAVLMWVSDQFGHRRRELEHLGGAASFFIGLVQVFALIPGSSRSGTTITGALFTGLTRESAARFSFLLSIPAVGASGLLELREALHLLNGTSMFNLGVATVVSAVVGYLSIAFLINYLRRHSTSIFVGYRFIVGAILILLAYRNF